MNCGECHLVDDLMFSEEGVYQSQLEVSRNTGICQSSAGRIIRDLFRDTQAEESNVRVR